MKRCATMSVIALLLASPLACGEDKSEGIGVVPPGVNQLTEPAPSGDPVEIFLAGIRAFNESNLEKLLTTFDVDTVWHVPTAPKPPAKGRKAVARQLVGFKGMLPDAKITVRRVLSAGELLAAQCLITASAKWDGQGIRKDEPRRIGNEVLYFVKAPDGPAKATLLYYDRAASRRQLGQMTGDPPPVPKDHEGDPEIIRGGGDPEAEKTAARLLGALAKGDVDTARTMLAEGFSFADMTTGERGGAALLEKRIADERGTIASSELTLRETVSAGRYIAVHWVRKAVRSDGKGALTLHGAHVLAMEGGKIASIDAYTSKMELIEQLGQLDRFRMTPGRSATAATPPDAGI